MEAQELHKSDTHAGSCDYAETRGIIAAAKEASNAIRTDVECRLRFALSLLVPMSRGHNIIPNVPWANSETSVCKS